ncbi:cyclophilin-like fold protein [Dyella marensis]|uniref:Cyclophilin-like domain-containing protein n=1 Tax=Dyella marensis TaxID=500610 RepID=A0A1I2J070_9GAMM|nr:MULTISPECIES: cyclophilin-like fold protein [Dyella]SFF47904.1 hypothetical protein SAMN02799615_03757 [Dyella marensis]
MQVTIRTAGRSVAVILDDTAIARDFAAFLPLKLELSDYGKVEKIADLPRSLDVAAEAAGYSPATGDVAFYAPWGNLAIFLHEFRYSDGLVRLGRIDAGLDVLAAPGALTVTIEATSVASQTIKGSQT